MKVNVSFYFYAGSLHLFLPRHVDKCSFTSSDINKKMTDDGLPFVGGAVLRTWRNGLCFELTRIIFASVPVVFL